jgi:hypothetical protein
VGKLFHNDLGDVISLFSVAQSQTGGSTYISSVRDIYEELVHTNPDVIPILTDDWISESYVPPRPIALIAR